MHMDKMDKKKALDLMIVLGNPAKPDDGKGVAEKSSEGTELEKMLEMHPLSALSVEELNELSEAVSSELAGRDEDTEDEE
jgi:hypothetical protein